MLKNYNIEIKKYEKIRFEALPIPKIKIENVLINFDGIEKNLKVKSLKIYPQLISIYNYKNLEHKCIISGDSKFQNIAAASILAKTYRDELMIKLDKKHPEYNWNNNKGYPTKSHKKSILEYGPSVYHRKSFRLFDIQTELKF